MPRKRLVLGSVLLGGLLAGLGLSGELWYGADRAGHLAHVTRLVSGLQEAADHLVRWDAYVQLFSRGRESIATRAALAGARDQLEQTLGQIERELTVLQSPLWTTFRRLQEEWQPARMAALRLERLEAERLADEGRRLGDEISGRVGAMQGHLGTLTVEGRERLRRDLRAMEAWRWRSRLYSIILLVVAVVGVMAATAMRGTRPTPT